MEDRLGETLALYLARRRRIRYTIRYPALDVLARGRGAEAAGALFGYSVPPRSQMSPGPARRGRLTAAGGRDDPGRALVRRAMFPVKHRPCVAKEGIRYESGAAPQR